MKIEKMHNGLHRCPIMEAANLMPEIREVLMGLSPQKPISEYVIDVKVHMLMPNQYPCIPNWHYDNVPRGDDNKQDFSQITRDAMYLWVSNAPLTEFNTEVGVCEIRPEYWYEFYQTDQHRGTAAKDFCWRLLIRACPMTILQPNPPDKWIRRHSQVYLDSANFTW